MRKQSAFSLVELSIVLVILGLLVGGVLAGQSLIRAAELRAVSTEYSRWVAATQTFRDKYLSAPGDFRDATRFWGRASSATDCVTNSAATITSVEAGSCDGNGNGIITIPAPSTFGENFLFWQHLARAGLIEGTYSGQAGPGTGLSTLLGVNSPRSRLQNAGWGVHNHNGTTHPGGPTTYTFDYGNMAILGATQLNTVPQGPAMRSEEAWNIDVKMDDGRPGGGNIFAQSGAAWGASNSCTTSTSQTDYAGEYRLNNNAVSCALFFRNIF